MPSKSFENEIARLQSVLAESSPASIPVAPPSATGGDAPIVCFLGIPGSGKSALIRKVIARCGVTRHHVGEFASRSGRIGAAEREAAFEGKLLEGLDELFLASVGPPAILDGFPRTERQFAAVTEWASRNRYDLSFAILEFPHDRAIRIAYQRQVARAEANARKAGHDAPEDGEFRRAVRKLERAVAVDLPLIETIKRSGYPVVTVDALNATNKLMREYGSAILSLLGAQRVE